MSTANRPAQKPLAGLKILVAEDETLLFFLAEAILIDLGCTEVRHAYRVQGALDLLARERVDFAVLDVNLAGERSYPIAEELTALKVPFIFTTGYGREGMPLHWADRAVVQKPFTTLELGNAIIAVLRNS
jgi:DNA-binding response OmpR family regulator